MTIAQNADIDGRGRTARDSPYPMVTLSMQAGTFEFEPCG